MQILNIAAYKFVALSDLPALQNAVLEAAQTQHLKGTVLLAEEGINLFLAAPVSAIHDFLAWLRRDPRFSDIQTKESFSSALAFRKLLVKIKPEIIRMNHPAIRPHDGRAPAVDAPTLSRWLDAGHDDLGRPVVMLDTRNDFEVDAGTFKNAIDWRIAKFTEFPQALQRNASQLDGKTVVSFCTGGIRCEKAAIFMQEIGLKHVYQLDGGILKYFEHHGKAASGKQFNGDCFVFDARRGVDTALDPVNVSAAPVAPMSVLADK